MEQKTYNNLENTIILIFVVILIALFLIGFTLHLIKIYKENLKESVVEFDAKYKPICDFFGGIYPQEGNYRNNWCYLNNSGILRKSCMKQINEQWHLLEC